MGNNIIKKKKTQGIDTIMIVAFDTRVHVKPLKLSFPFCVYDYPDILINSLIFISRYTQEEWLQVHPMEDHLYSYKN